MGSSAKWDDASSYAMGGGLMLGLGVGFFFLRADALAFVGCLLAGIGVGLMVAALVSSRKA